MERHKVSEKKAKRPKIHKKIAENPKKDHEKHNNNHEKTMIKAYTYEGPEKSCRPP
jgi:hypothetical protein